MNIVPYSSGYYKALVRIFEARRRFVIPEVFLPPTGLVAIHDGKFIGFGFMTKTDTPIAAIGNLVTEPTALGELRNEALNLIIGGLEQEAVKAGYNIVSAACSHRRLMARYEGMGYTETDTGLSLFLRVLCQSQAQWLSEEQA